MLDLLTSEVEVSWCSPSAELSYFFLPAGCMRDARLNGRYLPLDSQTRDGVSQVSIQGLSPGCSSDSCKRNQCSAPFTCVDLWRVHECRYTDTQSWPQDAPHRHSEAWGHMHLTLPPKPLFCFWPWMCWYNLLWTSWVFAEGELQKTNLPWALFCSKAGEMSSSLTGASWNKKRLFTCAWGRWAFRRNTWQPIIFRVT